MNVIAFEELFAIGVIAYIGFMAVCAVVWGWYRNYKRKWGENP